VLLDTPAGSQVVIENLHAAEDAQVELLGHGEALSWQQNGRHLVIELPGEVSDAVAHALRIRPTPWRLTQ